MDRELVYKIVKEQLQNQFATHMRSSFPPNGKPASREIFEWALRYFYEQRNQALITNGLPDKITQEITIANHLKREGDRLYPSEAMSAQFAGTAPLPFQADMKAVQAAIQLATESAKSQPVPSVSEAHLSQKPPLSVAVNDSSSTSEQMTRGTTSTRLPRVKNPTRGITSGKSRQNLTRGTTSGKFVRNSKRVKGKTGKFARTGCSWKTNYNKRSITHTFSQYLWHANGRKSVALFTISDAEYRAADNIWIDALIAQKRQEKGLSTPRPEDGHWFQFLQGRNTVTSSPNIQPLRRRG